VFGVFALMVPEAACIPVPSEVTLMSAGFAAHQGIMSLPLAILAATAGNVAGSLLAYALGASPLLSRVPRKAGPLARCEQLLRRHGTRAVFVARLLPLARTFVSLPAGTQHVPLPAFVALTAAGSAIWAAVFIGLGVFAGAAWVSVAAALGPVLAVAGLVLVLVLLLRQGRSRR
jgi:membrane protein DedA with SNARE-associated domain